MRQLLKLKRPMAFQMKTARKCASGMGIIKNPINQAPKPYHAVSPVVSTMPHGRIHSFTGFTAYVRHRNDRKCQSLD